MLAERIESRRQELGLSQAELARRSKVPQTTLNSIVKRGRRSTPHLLRIAYALQTSPAYLTGATDDPGQDAPEGVRLSASEEQLLDDLRAMATKDRVALCQLARSLAKIGTPGSENG